jgi:hypothetical protein
MSTKIVDFLEKIVVVVGMPRAGTTWLYENINLHPNVAISDRKEINRYLLPMSNEEYVASFDFGGARQVGLDISPAYYLDEGALERIDRAGHRVVVISRERASWESSFRSQLLKQGLTDNRGVYQVRAGTGCDITFDMANFDYDGHLARVLDRFRGKILVLRYEDISIDPVQFLNDIEEFSEIPSFFNEVNIIRSHVNSGSTKISSIYMAVLRLPFFDLIARVALAILPRGIVHWARRRFVYGYASNQKRSN